MQTIKIQGLRNTAAIPDFVRVVHVYDLPFRLCIAMPLAFSLAIKSRLLLENMKSVSKI